MVFYLSIALILWLLALLDIKNSILRPLFRVIAFTLLVGVAGLRFETGYDWMVYDQVFVEIAKNESLINIISQFNMEPAFIALCKAIDYLGGGLQSLFIVVAVFNFYAILKYLSLTKGSFLFGVSIYFCWIYLPVQMGVIRQSIGCSLVFLAIYYLINQRKFLSLLLLCLGSLFQVSILIYLVLLTSFFSKVFRKMEFLIVAISIIFIFVGWDISLLLFSIFSKIDIGFVSEKIIGYSSGLQKTASITSQLYFVFNVVLYVFFRFNSSLKDKVTVFEFNILLFFLILQGLVWAFPLGWNRVQYVAILIQARILYIYIYSLDCKFKIFFSVFSVFSVSLTVLWLLLKNPNSVPYIPYTSYLEKIIYNESNNGRIRAENYYIDFDDMMRQKNSN